MDQVFINDSAGNHKLPITHFNSVRDSQGNTLTSVLGAVKDSVNEERAYVPANYSGMGRVVLKKNIKTISEVEANYLEQSMLTATNTVYVIKYDFTLAENITIPANCVLEFEGGSISASGSNDSITGNNTQIKAQDVTIFKNGIIIAGTWNCPRITTDWFENIGNTNAIKQLVNLSINDIHNDIIVKSGTYNVAATNIDDYIIDLKKDTTFYLNGNIVIQSNNYGQYCILRAKNDNIKITGTGSIIGDRLTHQYSMEHTSEWCHGVVVGQSTAERAILTSTPKNIIIEGIHVENCPGDGIDVRSADGIIIENITIDRCRRQGITLAYVTNVIVQNFTITNICTIDGIQYTAPGSGIDIEPDPEGNHHLYGVRILNGYIDNVISGISSNIDSSSGTVFKKIEISNVIIKGFIFYGISTFGFDTTIIQNVNLQGKGRGIACDNRTTIDSVNINVGITDYEEIPGSCEAIFNLERPLDIRNSDISSEKYAFRLIAKTSLNNCTIAAQALELMWINNPNPDYATSINKCKITLTNAVNQYNKAFVYDSIFNIPRIVFNTNAIDSVVKGNVFVSPATSGEEFIRMLTKIIFNQNRVTLVDGSSYNSPIVADADLGCIITDNIVEGTNVYQSREYIGFLKGNCISNYGLYPSQGYSVDRPVLTNNVNDKSNIGLMYFDNTLMKPIFWRGDTWVDATGATV